MFSHEILKHGKAWVRGYIESMSSTTHPTPRESRYHPSVCSDMPLCANIESAVTKIPFKQIFKNTGSWIGNVPYQVSLG